MASQDNLQTVATSQLVAGAEMMMRAQKVQHRYRVVACRISSLNGQVCEYGPEDSVISTSKEAAKIVYIQRHAAALVNDVTGDWSIGVVCLKNGLNANETD